MNGNDNVKPNIIIFFVDDMGYGDVSCLNPKGKISTPNFDRLAREGMIFTDAHSTSAVCSPSRYSVLTGRYNWRSRLQKGIVGVYGDALIDRSRLTLPGMLKQNGYHTACIGKWHLGMGWDFEKDNDFIVDGTTNFDKSYHKIRQQKWHEAFSKTTTDGPTTRGFDYYYGVDVPNWPPYCFIENDHTVGIPSVFLPDRLIGNNLASRIGPAMPYWHFEQLLPTWAEKADEYITTRAGKNEPFFLYLPITTPHTPLSVNKKWIGKSHLNNAYADLVMETDDIFGQVLDSLEKNDIVQNTLVIFASDNGCAHYIGTDQLEAQGHFPSAQFRGYKSDIWDGGHRIPFIVRWPKSIKTGSVCNELVSLSDIMATCADIIDYSCKDNCAEDSVSIVPLLQGKSNTVRTHTINHSIQGKFAIRDEHWKLVLCPGSGGWAKNDAEAVQENLPLLQLYDLKNDPGEKNNIYTDYPEKVKKMISYLKRIVSEGRSTPGKPQENDVEIDIYKSDTMPGVSDREFDDY